MKVFLVGFNKCGTRSLASYLESRGLKTVHWDAGNLARTIKSNLAAGDYVLKGYEDYEAFCDITYLSAQEHIEGCRYYPEYMKLPDAKFILNTRDKDGWIGSRLDHPGYADRFSLAYNCQTAEDAVAIWSKVWDDQHREVVRDIPADRLLIFNIESDDPEKIDRFLGFDDDQSSKLDHIGWLDGQFYKDMHETTPAFLRNLVPGPLKQKIRYALRKKR